MQMQNLGLFKGYPPQASSKEEAVALFRENQKNHPLTRQTEADRILTMNRQSPKKLMPKNPG